MSILIAMPHRDPQPLVVALQYCAPEIPVCIWPEIPAAADITMAVLWQHPQGLLSSLPKLQVAHSFGAGVEHILNDPALSSDIQIARVSGPKLASSMTSYLVRQVVAARPLIRDGSIAIGMLGYGQLAQAAAKVLLEQGYRVMAWRRTGGDAGEVSIYHGKTGLEDMLQQTDVLICLLPLTPDTTDIINHNSLAKCKPGMYLINVGRGAHVVEPDVLAAIDAGQLSGACLDVTRNEPIAATDPLTVHPDVKLTQHTASLTDPCEAAAVIAENYRRLMAGKVLKFVVNRQFGY